MNARIRILKSFTFKIENNWQASPESVLLRAPVPDSSQVPNVEHGVRVPGPEPHALVLLLVDAHVAAAAGGAHQEAGRARRQQLRPDQLRVQLLVGGLDRRLLRERRGKEERFEALANPA